MISKHFCRAIDPWFHWLQISDSIPNPPYLNQCIKTPSNSIAGKWFLSHWKRLKLHSHYFYSGIMKSKSPGWLLETKVQCKKSRLHKLWSQNKALTINILDLNILNIQRLSQSLFLRDYHHFCFEDWVFLHVTSECIWRKSEHPSGFMF